MHLIAANLWFLYLGVEICQKLFLRHEVCMRKTLGRATIPRGLP